MRQGLQTGLLLSVLSVAGAGAVCAQELPEAPTFETGWVAGAAAERPSNRETEAMRAAYILGPYDEITVKSLEAEEITGGPLRVDQAGYISLPLIGRVRAAGYTRRSSLDELPQLFNVLLGQMSLVGPRPLPAEDLDPDGHSRQFGEWAETRSRVLPGITGLWQVSGRSELPFEKMVELDTRYVSDCSLVLDLRILLETPLAVLNARGAY